MSTETGPVHPEAHAGFRPGDRVEWNPTGDTWLPGTVGQLHGSHYLIVLHENGQALHVRPEHLRLAEPQRETVATVQADRDRLAAELAELHTWRGLMSLLDEHWPADVFDGSPDDGDPGPRIVFLVRQVNRHREQLARDLADTPDPALKMRVAELVAVREQCRAGESDCDAWWELADLRWGAGAPRRVGGCVVSSPSGPLDPPADLAAVQADDALLDALRGPNPTPKGDAWLVQVLAAWRAEVDSEPAPQLVDVDTALAIVRARSRRSLAGRTADAVRRIVDALRRLGEGVR